MITAEILADSLAPMGARLTTFRYTAPRSILAEINTHRVFSRNAASSRAIPVKTLIKSAQENPFTPIWNRNKPGMQGDFDFSPEEVTVLEGIWNDARADALKHAARMAEAGGHKQSVNRIIEPYVFVQGVISSTEWYNFFKLRTNAETVQPEFLVLAQKMKELLERSQPTRLLYDEWHLPFVTAVERTQFTLEELKNVSAARCARVSYRTFNNNSLSEPHGDLILCQSLDADAHYSPFEHQATPAYPLDSTHDECQGNYNGFVQNRKLIELVHAKA